MLNSTPYEEDRFISYTCFLELTHKLQPFEQRRDHMFRIIWLLPDPSKPNRTYLQNVMDSVTFIFTNRSSMCYIFGITNLGVDCGPESLFCLFFMGMHMYMFLYQCTCACGNTYICNLMHVDTRGKYRVSFLVALRSPNEIEAHYLGRCAGQV